MSMHSHFANWYRPAAVEPRAETLENRWKAIEAFSEELKIGKALELVRLFFEMPLRNREFVGEYREAFKAADPAFLMKDNDFELRVLAGASIIELLENYERSSLTDATALAIACTLCQGMRSEVLNADVVEAARRYLSDESIRVRQIGNIPSVEGTIKETDKSFAELKTAVEGNTVAGLKDPLTAVLKKLQLENKRIVDTANEAIGNLTLSLRIQREESNILWWLFGEYSRDLDRPFVGMNLPAVCLIAAKELADLTEFLPGPYASRGHLDGVLRLAENPLPNSTAIRNAVSDVTPEWRETILDDAHLKEVNDLCPVHYALRKVTESTDGADWVAQFDKATGLKAKKAIAPLDLSVQFYQERLLLRAIQE